MVTTAISSQPTVTQEVPSSRLCRKCKNPGEFSPALTNKDGLSKICKLCAAGEARDRRVRNRERYKEINRKSNLRRYGLTVEDYNKILAEQGGLCAICRKPCTVNPSLSVDHDHKTGKVRGLLCSLCNQALGLAKDSPEVLEALARYLRENS